MEELYLKLDKCENILDLQKLLDAYDIQRVEYVDKIWNGEYYVYPHLDNNPLTFYKRGCSNNIYIVNSTTVMRISDVRLNTIPETISYIKDAIFAKLLYKQSNVFLCPLNVKYTIRKSQLYVIQYMENIPCNLHTYLSLNVSENSLRRFITDVHNILLELYEKYKFVHGDLHVGNILIDYDQETLEYKSFRFIDLEFASFTINEKTFFSNKFHIIQDTISKYKDFYVFISSIYLCHKHRKILEKINKDTAFYNEYLVDFITRENDMQYIFKLKFVDDCKSGFTIFNVIEFAEDFVAEDFIAEADDYF